MKIGFLGAGRIAQALTKGFIESGTFNAGKILASCPEADKHLLEEIKSLGCQTTHQNQAVVDQADILILALKPGVVPRVLQEVSPGIQARHLVVSLAMGVTIHEIEQKLPEKTRVIRVMPNTPCLVREGASVFSKGSTATQADGDEVCRLLRSVGICEEVPETMMDAVTGLSGSGPAYMYLAIEALADGAVREGLPRDLSYRLAAQTVLGAAKMVLSTGKHPGALKDDVCSPAGTTAEGICCLEKNGYRSSLIEAVTAATAKARQTGQLRGAQAAARH